MQLRRKLSPPHSDRYNKPLLGWADPDSLTWLIYTCQNNVCLLNSKFKPQTSITYHQRTALDPDRCGWKCYVVTWMHRDSCGDSEDACCPHYRVVNSSAPEVFLQLEVQTFLASPIKRSLDRVGVHIESWHLFFLHTCWTKSEAVVTLVIPNERRKMSYFLLSAYKAPFSLTMQAKTLSPSSHRSLSLECGNAPHLQGRQSPERLS